MTRVTDIFARIHQALYGETCIGHIKLTDSVTIRLCSFGKTRYTNYMGQPYNVQFNVAISAQQLVAKQNKMRYMSRSPYLQNRPGA